MYLELYHYLLQHKKLSLPGIGTLLLSRKPAQPDFPNKQILPPVYSFTMQRSAPVPPGSFFARLGSLLGITQMDAVIRFNNFVFDIKKQLESNDAIHWNGVGMFRMGQAGEVDFIPHDPLPVLKPVKAEKVLRDNAEHFILVGEQERSSAEMAMLLSETKTPKSNWWMTALVIGVLAFIFTGWYLSKNGTEIQSTANNKRLIPAVSASSYTELP